MTKQRIMKDVVPDDFTLSLALVDAIPVFFFGLNCVVLGKLCNNLWFIIGAILCLWAGSAKVLWKFIVVLYKRNIWFLFIQMRIIMPIGFLMMLISTFLSHISFESFIKGFTSIPSVYFFGLGIFGMILMLIFAFMLNNKSLKANWIEQLTNGISQICIFIGLLLL